MPLFGSTKNNTTLYETLTENNLPTGVEGTGNRTVGAYGTDSSQQFGAPISDVGDGNLIAPMNFYAPSQSVGNRADAGTVQAARDAYLATQTPGYNISESQFVNWWRNNLGAYNLNDYPEEIAYLRAIGATDVLNRAGVPLTAPPAPPPSVDSSSNGVNIGQFGGAVQGSGTVAGQVNAPVASGNDSVAQQVGVGAAVGGDVFDSVIIAAPVSAPIIQGDVLAPVVNVTAPVAGPVITVNDNSAPVIAPSGPVNAPITGIGGDALAPVVVVTDPAGPVITTGGDVLAPIVNADASGGGVSAPISAGGDIEVNAPVISGVNGNVTIVSSDADVARAAIDAAQQGLNSSLAFANRALDTVADAGRDPSEKTANAALWVAGLLAFAAIAAS